MTTRQAASTTVWEFAGKRCDALLAVAPASRPHAAICGFIQVDGTWFRFTMDVGVLFLDQVRSPSNEEIDPDDVRVSLLDADGPVRRIASFQFSVGIASILLDDGSCVQFKERPDGWLEIVHNRQMP